MPDELSTEINGLASAPEIPNVARVGPTPRISSVLLLAPEDKFNPEVAIVFAAKVTRVDKLVSREEVDVLLTSYTSTIALPEPPEAPDTCQLPLPPFFASRQKKSPSPKRRC